MKPKFKFKLGQIVQHKTTNTFVKLFIVLGRYYLEEIGCKDLREMYNVRNENTYHVTPMMVDELKEYIIGTVGDV